MDRETAIASVRSYLGACIEIKAIPDKEVERLSFYFSGDRRDYYFFYYRGHWETLGVGGSNCVAVSKKTGKLAYVGMVGE